MNINIGWIIPMVRGTPGNESNEKMNEKINP